MLRSVFGFLLAPAVPALIVLALEAARVPASDAVRAAMAVGLFGYLSALVLGVPAHFLLRKGEHTNVVAYLLTGALIGVACYAALFVPGVVQNWHANPEGATLMLRNTAGFALLGAVCGSLAAVVFWVVAVRPLRRAVR